MWDLSSSTRDQTRTPCIGRRSPNYWTAREVPVLLFRRLSGVLRWVSVGICWLPWQSFCYPCTFARATMGQKLNLNLLHPPSAPAHGVGVSRALPGEREKIGGGCKVLLRLLKYPRSGGISGLFSLAASPKSPQGMEGNLSSTEPKTWAGQLGRKWREWGRRLLFGDEANFQIWPWNLLI